MCDDASVIIIAVSHDDAERAHVTPQIFKSGDTTTPGPYDGPREADGIVKYLKKQVLPAMQLLESEKAVKAFKDAADIALIVYVPSNTSAEFEVVAKVADAMRSDLDGE